MRVSQKYTAKQAPQGLLRRELNSYSSEQAKPPTVKKKASAQPEVITLAVLGRVLRTQSNEFPRSIKGELGLRLRYLIQSIGVVLGHGDGLALDSRARLFGLGEAILKDVCATVQLSRHRRDELLLSEVNELLAQLELSIGARRNNSNRVALAANEDFDLRQNCVSSLCRHGSSLLNLRILSRCFDLVIYLLREAALENEPVDSGAIVRQSRAALGSIRDIVSLSYLGRYSKKSYSGYSSNGTVGLSLYFAASEVLTELNNEARLRGAQGGGKTA